MCFDIRLLITILFYRNRNKQHRLVKYNVLFLPDRKQWTRNCQELYVGYIRTIKDTNKNSILEIFV